MFLFSSYLKLVGLMNNYKYLAKEIILKEFIYIDFYLTNANNRSIIRTKFTEIGSGIYEKRNHKNTNESKR